MNYALILAGGTGERVGAGIPKQFIEVLGKPIMIHTLETYQSDPMINEIVLVCVETHIQLARRLCEEYHIDKTRAIIPGGASFLKSCIHGVNYLAGCCSPDDIVVVTSADRPFTSTEEIRDSILTAQKHGSGVAARKCARCMFEVGEDRSRSNRYLRDTLVETGTPWSFLFGPLKCALERFEAGELPHCEPYPPAIYAADGREVYVSVLSPINIKITEKTDIAVMEQLLKERKHNG